MAETLVALLFAHVLADFVLQTGWMARGKAGRGALALLAHGAIVAATAAAATGALAWPVALLTGLHLAIDVAKGFAPAGRLWPFLADQAAHVASILGVAALAPDLYATGLWADLVAPDGLVGLAAALPHGMALFAGFVIATRAGGFAVGLLMGRFAADALSDGLPGAGRLIGLLERGLIFLFVLIGQPGGIGFLIAAKSILRFDTARADQRAGEYVIIGTLASFGWALAAAWATLWLLEVLPPLHIAARDA